jgi:UDP-N-acetylmuramoylalanine--D-glutamate ligase
LPASSTGTLPAVLLVEGFRAAFDAAVESAEEGDAVLLSPACASFDEFDSFEQRGAVFKELVAAHATGAHAADAHAAGTQGGA